MQDRWIWVDEEVWPSPKLFAWDEDEEEEWEDDLDWEDEEDDLDEEWDEEEEEDEDWTEWEEEFEEDEEETFGRRRSRPEWN